MLFKTPNYSTHNFLKDIIWVLVVLAVSFLPYLHVLGDSDADTFYFLSLRYTHDWGNNELFLWMTLNNLQFIIFILLVFYGIRDRVRYVLLLPLGFSIHWFFYITLSFSFYEEYQKLIILMSASTTLLIALLSLGSFRLTIGGGLFSKVLLPKPFELFYVILLLCSSLFVEWIAKTKFNTDEFSILGLTIGSFGFDDISEFFWVIVTKLLLLIVALTGYFRIKSWKRFVFFIPLLLVVFQLKNIFTYSKVIDEYEIVQSLPLLLAVLVFLLMLSESAFHKAKLTKLYQNASLNVESYRRLHPTKSMKRLQEQKKRFATLKKEPQDCDTSTLEKLKSDLEQQLRKVNG